MQVSVETTKGLERKVTIQVPATTFEEEVTNRLKDLAKKVKLDGFRPGKVPFNVVKKRFSLGVRDEVANEMVKKTLFEALSEKELSPAGQPYVEPQTLETDKDFIYTATFEIFPEIKPAELEGEELTKLESTVTDADVDAMIEKLREQQKDWADVERKVADGDKILLNFDGYVDGEAFDGGKAEGHELIIGSNSMIPGFESGLIGAEIDKEMDLNVTFPADYQHSDLAGKDAVFKVTVTKVQEGQLPELNDEFAKKFNIEEGGIDALKVDIRQNMERELDRKLKSSHKEAAFDAFLNKNEFDVPTSLIDQEISNLQQEMVQRVFGHQQIDQSKLPELPRDMFEEQAVKRVKLGLLVSEYIKLHEIKADDEAINDMLESMAQAYEKPDELKQWYRSDKQRLGEIEAAVLEEKVVEKICENATMINKTQNYDEVMNPKPEVKDDEKGENE